MLDSKLKQARSPFIMHMATHGFFLEDQKTGPGWDISKAENPLLRSGLALAGANTFIKGGTPPDEAEDGILTAEDVSGMDLTGTELVVLSACDTGLGSIRAGEGVFGFRRAFMLAGAKTLVMTLWKVPDLATPILMERFYENLLNRRMDRDKALREAQLFTRDLTIGDIKSKWLSDEMIENLCGGDSKGKKELRDLSNHPDEYKPFTDSLYWGAFICQGDTIPIPQ